MIYLDSAATTLQKPESVAAATAWAVNHLASPGRGGHRPAMAAAEKTFACREAAARLFHVEDLERVVFTFNATHGLNIAIKSLVRPGDTVVISGYEHNAVTRPIHAVGDVQVRVVNARLFDPAQMAEGFEKAVDEKVRAVVCTHVSNVFGYILPIQEIAALCRSRGVPLIVDASQSAGILPVNLQKWGAAYVAMPGHRGLYGPQGTGLLLCGEGQPRPLLEGGTGSLSRQQEMPDFLPDRLEAGTQNVHGAAGLLEGLRFVRRQGLGRIAGHEAALIRQLAEGLRRKGTYHVYDGGDSPVLSVIPRQTDPESAADLLARQGVAVRAGLHCAPLAHQTAGTSETGTMRFSASVFNTPEEVVRLIRAFHGILGRAF